MSADNARRDDFFKNFGIPLPIAPRPRAPPSFIRPPTPLHLVIFLFFSYSVHIVSVYIYLV